jgi:hypothetical protein
MSTKPIPKSKLEMPMGEPGPRSVPSKDDIYDALDSIAGDAGMLKQKIVASIQATHKPST